MTKFKRSNLCFSMEMLYKCVLDFTPGVFMTFRKKKHKSNARGNAHLEGISPRRSSAAWKHSAQGKPSVPKLGACSAVGGRRMSKGTVPSAHLWLQQLQPGAANEPQTVLCSGEQGGVCFPPSFCPALQWLQTKHPAAATCAGFQSPSLGHCTLCTELCERKPVPWVPLVCLLVLGIAFVGRGKEFLP